MMEIPSLPDTIPDSETLVKSPHCSEITDKADLDEGVQLRLG